MMFEYKALAVEVTEKTILIKSLIVIIGIVLIILAHNYYEHQKSSNYTYINSFRELLLIK